jgi:hypothetical protein
MAPRALFPGAFVETRQSLITAGAATTTVGASPEVVEQRLPPSTHIRFGRGVFGRGDGPTVVAAKPPVVEDWPVSTRNSS